MKREQIKPFAWGMAVGAIVLLIVIFSAGWVTDAVLERLAPIAVAQFMQDPNREERLKEMKKLESWGANNRSDYVQKQGWATMPGEKEPDGRVADECARRLVDLKM